jgi:DNA-binding PucR family transcriptional regulator
VEWRGLGDADRCWATARELGVHVNTVRHRLNRFEEATGRSLHETEAIVEVWWALQRQQLS